MKRPFAVIGFTSFGVLLVPAFSERSDVALCVFVCAFALGVFSLFIKNLRQAVTVPVCLFTAAFACLLFLGFNTQKAEVQSLTGESVAVEAVVSEAPYMKADTGRHYCVMKLVSVDSQKVKGKIRLSFLPSKDGIEDGYLEIGNTVSFTGKVYVPGVNEKSISRYFTGENILLGAYGATDFSFSVPSFRGVNFYFHRLRSFVSKTLRYGFGDRIAGLLVGILTGDKSCLDDGLYKAFRDTGVAHLMAVSGLHLSVWVFSLGSVIPERGRSAKLKYLFLIFAVLFIMLLAGMSESVKRAGFMSLVMLSGKLSSRQSDSLNSLGFSVFLMILFNPVCVLSVSLQLSFLSTLGILTLGALFMKRTGEIFGGKKINTPFKKLARSCADTFFISISVLVFTFPVLIFNFGGISTVSAWVNILLAPVVTPLLLLSGVYVLVAGLSFVSLPVAVIVKLISEYVIFVTRSFSQIRNAFLPFEAENLPLYIAATVLIVLLSIAFLKRSNAREKAALTAIAVVVSVGLVGFYENKADADRIFHLADYEGEIAVAVEKDKRAVLLEDMPLYERGLFASYLDSRGVELFAVKKDEEYQCLLDGKYIYDFSCEALQYAADCDIIIEKCGGGAVIGIDGEEIFLENGEEMRVKR